MATETVHLHDLPSAADAKKVAEERKADAKKHFEILKKEGVANSRTSLRIGWHAYYLKKNGLFGMLGFETEEQAREAADVGDSTWYGNIKIAEAFQGIEEEQFCSMKQANARRLSDLPESERLSREWIRMAGSMKIKEFGKKCDEFMGDRAKPSDSKEKGTVLRMPMPVSRLEVIEKGVEKYAEVIGTDKGDLGKALEVMVVEQTQRPSLIGAITTAAQRISKARELRKSSGLSAEELLDKVYGILDDIALDFNQALATVENLDAEPAE